MARSTGQKGCLSLLRAIFSPRAQFSGNRISGKLGPGLKMYVSEFKQPFWPSDLAVDAVPYRPLACAQRYPQVFLHLQRIPQGVPLGDTPGVPRWIP